jgi:hypothetical protein
MVPNYMRLYNISKRRRFCNLFLIDFPTFARFALPFYAWVKIRLKVSAQAFFYFYYFQSAALLDRDFTFTRMRAGANFL